MFSVNGCSQATCVNSRPYKFTNFGFNYWRLAALHQVNFSFGLIDTHNCVTAIGKAARADCPYIT
jgi:hypothetical protein